MSAQYGEEWEMGLFSHVLPYVSNRNFFHCTQLTFRSSTLLRLVS